MAMFRFQLADYADPALEDETAELLRQRLERYSRQAVPGMWKAADALNESAAQGPGRETRQRRDKIYAVILTVLGVFVLIPGLMQPQAPVLIAAGALALLSGLALLLLGRKPRSAGVPAACREEARKLLERQRSVDWNTAKTQITFADAAWTISSGDKQETIPYEQVSGLFETEHLWLLVYGQDKALLLQKRDLVTGGADGFAASVRQKAKLEP